MSVLMPDEGKIDAMNLWLGHDLFGATLRLYTNTPTVDHSVTDADLVEAGWAGYNAAALNSWGSPYLTPDFHARADHPNVSFTNTSGSDQTYQGWWMRSGAGSMILLINDFGTPQTIHDGETITFGPFFQQQTE